MNQLEAKEKQLEAAYTANQAAIAKASGGEYTETFGLMVGSRSYDKTLDVQRDAAWKALEKAKEEVSAAQSKSEDHKQKMELGETDKAKLEEDQQAFHSAAYLFTALPNHSEARKQMGTANSNCSCRALALGCLPLSRPDTLVTRLRNTIGYSKSMLTPTHHRRSCFPTTICS